MAKKLTPKQRQSRKQAQYKKAEYNKNIDAIKYYQKLGVDIPNKALRIPKRITKTSLKYIRKIYKEVRANIKQFADEFINVQTGEVLPITSLPTKEKAAKYYRHPEETPQEQYIDIDVQYIDELKDKIWALQPLRDSDKTAHNYNKNVVPKQQKVKQKFVEAIDDAIRQYGAAIVANALAQNEYMQRVGNLEEKYTYEIVEDISEGDGNLIDLMYASAGKALETL